MSEFKNWRTLGTLVDDFLDDNLLGQGMFMKALKWAQRGLSDIRMDVQQTPKSCLLPVTERKTVVLPVDFVDWVKIAVKKGQYAITLAVNDQLTTIERTTDEDVISGLLSQHLPNGTNFDAYGGYQFLNYDSGYLYGVGYGFPSKGYFKVVDRGVSKELMMDYDYNFSQVYIEYITDGLSPCKETSLHPYEYEYMLVYLETKYETKGNPKASLGSKREAEVKLLDAERKLRARYNDLTPQDMLTMSRAEARMTTKI